MLSYRQNGEKERNKIDGRTARYYDGIEKVGAYLLGVRDASERTGRDFSIMACKTACAKLEDIIESIEKGADLPGYFQYHDDEEPEE